MKFIEKLEQDLKNGVFKNGLILSYSHSNRCDYETLDDKFKRHFYTCCGQSTNKNAIIKNFCKKNNIKIINKYHSAINVHVSEQEYYKAMIES